MHTSVRRGLQIALVVGGGIFFSAQAHADDTSGADSILGGNQAVVAIEAPVTVGGNAVSVVGDSTSSDSSTTSPAPSEPAGSTGTSGEDSAGGGNQAAVTVRVPVTVSGSAVSVVGDSSSEDSSTSVGDSGSAPVRVGDTSGEDSAGGGNQGVAQVTAPVTVGGNAVSVIGDADSEGASTGAAGGSGSSSGDGTTSGEDSALGGNQVALPVTAPVTAGGNAVSVVGDSRTNGAEVASGGAGTGSGSTSGSSTSGEDSALGGNQVALPVTAPVTAGGNAVSGIGDATSTGSTSTGGGTTPGTTSGGGTTTGEESVGGGNQVTAPVTAPVTAGGNAVTVVGDATTGGGTTGPTPTEPSDPADPTDPGGPTDPVDPTDPTDPTDPAGPGEVVDDATNPDVEGAAGAPSTTTVTRVVAADELARTGVETASLLGLALGLLTLGAFLLGASRRRVVVTT